MPALELSTEATRLLQALRQHGATSRASAITDRRLAELTGLPERDLVDAAGELLQAGYLALATSGHPSGRWLGTVADAAAYDRSLGRRAKLILIRRRTLRHAIRCQGQLDLFSEAVRCSR